MIITSRRRLDNKIKRFKYLGSIVRENGRMDASCRIRGRWTKWREAITRVLCDKILPLKGRGKEVLYKSVVRPETICEDLCVLGVE